MEFRHGLELKLPACLPQVPAFWLLYEFAVVNGPNSRRENCHRHFLVVESNNDDLD